MSNVWMFFATAHGMMKTESPSAVSDEAMRANGYAETLTDVDKRGNNP